MSSLSQMAIAGNQSKCDTSIDCFSICAAKHLALVIRHDSPAALPEATVCARIFLMACCPTPVEGSVTSCRNLRLRYVATSEIVSTCGSHQVTSRKFLCLRTAAANPANGPATAPAAVSPFRNFLRVILPNLKFTTLLPSPALCSDQRTYALRHFRCGMTFPQPDMRVSGIWLISGWH